jgi:hypothetical protein
MRTPTPDLLSSEYAENIQDQQNRSNPQETKPDRESDRPPAFSLGFPFATRNPAAIRPHHSLTQQYNYTDEDR